MKKHLYFICAAVLCAACALTGCAGSDTFTQKSYSSDENAVESVCIELFDRQVDIGVSDDGRVHIEYFDGEKEFLEITLSEEKALTVRLACDKKWYDFIGYKARGEYGKVSVKLPRGIAALSVATTDADINVGAVEAGQSVALVCNGGDIVFGGLSVGGEISLDVKNGNISGSVVGGMDDYSIKCEIKKGDSNLPTEKAGGEKSLTVVCNNGDINIEFVK